MGLGQPSPWIPVKTGTIDRTWHLMVRLMETSPRGLGGTIRTYTTLQARSSAASNWTTVTTNRSISMPVTCFGFTQYCVRSLLFWENDPRYDQYQVQLRFEHDHLLSNYLGDVEFEAVTTPDRYARIALGFKHAYGILSLILTIFWIVFMRCIKGYPYSTWNWEQRYLTVLLVGLNIYNNPIYGIQYWTASPFFPWWNSFAEILYVGIALGLWLSYISRFKRAVMYENYLLDREYLAATTAEIAANIDAINALQANQGSVNQDGTVGGDGDFGHGPNPISPSYDPNDPHPSHSSAYYDNSTDEPIIAPPVNDDDPIIEGYSFFYIILAIIYILLTGGLFLWGALRDRMTPIDTLRHTGSAFQLLYYAAAAFYTFLVVLLAIKLSFNTIGARRHRDLLWGRYVFFAGPTTLLACSLVFGLFTSNIGPYASNMVGFLVYSALFNSYIYFMIWAYWPNEGAGYSAVTSSETASIFAEAGPSYSSHL